MVSRRLSRVGLLLPLGLLPVLVLSFAGCSSASGAGTEAAGTRPGLDAGSHKTPSADARADGTSQPSDDGTGADGGSGVAEDSGSMETTTPTDGEAGAPDAGKAGGVCLAHLMECSYDAAAPQCCTDTCKGHVCGCLPEGAQLFDGGIGTCCDGLAVTDGGYCGTSACVPDGTPCGDVDGGVVCCNDDCNGTTCGP